MKSMRIQSKWYKELHTESVFACVFLGTASQSLGNNVEDEYPTIRSKQRLRLT